MDYIFSNSVSASIYPRVIHTDLNNHFIIYCAVNLNHDIKPMASNKNFYRDVNNVNVENYLQDRSVEMTNFENTLNQVQILKS